MPSSVKDLIAVIWWAFVGILLRFSSSSHSTDETPMLIQVNKNSTRPIPGKLGSTTGTQPAQFIELHRHGFARLLLKRFWTLV
jgi:hypothetical protein